MPGLGEMFPLALGAGAIARDLTLVLGACAAVAMLFHRLKLEAIPGFLVAGVLLGPGVFGLVEASETVTQMSSLAVVLLLFGIGLHLDMGAIRRGMVHILAIGAVSTLLFASAAWLALSLAGLPPPVGLVIALALAMSSTAVLVRMLTTRREFTTVHGRVGLGTAIVQDLVAVIALAVIPPLGRWAGVPQGHEPDAIGQLPGWLAEMARAGVALGGVTLMLLAGRALLPRLLAAVAKTGSGELMLIVAGAIAFGSAVLTRLLGFSPEMGAFLAGLLLAGTPFRYQLSGQLAPLRDLFMAVFFTAVGLQLDVPTLISGWWIVLLGAAGVIVVKWFALGVSGWALGMSATTAAVAATSLANAGEFTLVILNEASRLQLVSGPHAALVTAVVIVTLVVSPLLMEPGRVFARRLARVPLAGGRSTPAIPRAQIENEGETDRETGAEDVGERGGKSVPRGVIVAGFGPVGRALADSFDRRGIPFTVIELNPGTVERQARLGRRFVYGDATNAEVLESAGVRAVDAVILTFPDDDATLRAVGLIRTLAPGVFIAARTNYLSGSLAARSLGADHVTVEELACAQAMEREVLEKLSTRGARPGPSPA